VLKAESQAEISLGQSGLCMKATLYICFQFRGSDTNWYKNLLVYPTLKISVNGVEISERGKPITASNSIDYVVRKFRSKYGEGDVKKYYPKTEVAVEVPL
jgi:hypothetical protein